MEGGEGLAPGQASQTCPEKAAVGADFYSDQVGGTPDFTCVISW